MKSQSSYYEKGDDSREWSLIDADGQVLGRLASKIANVLRGKNKPTYTPSVNMGDFVVVINSDKVVVTGKKETDKFYHRHSRYPGGLTSVSFKEQVAKDSTKVILSAVKGMLPKGRLGRTLLTKVKVYSGSEHPHQAQLSHTKGEV